MLKSYLIIAWRNLARNSVYTFINIGGLAIGIACAILIFLWVWDEITFDQLPKNADRLGRLLVNNEFSDKIITSSHAPLPLYEYLKSSDARIKNVSVSHEGERLVIAVGEKRIWAEGKFVSPEFLNMFQHPWVRGVKDDALKNPFSIVLTESGAHALFGDRDPMSQPVLLDNKFEFKVTGIIKDLPDNSSIGFDFLLPWSHYANSEWRQENDNWDNEPVQIFIELEKGANLDEVNTSLTNLLRAKRGQGSKSELFIFPMTDWHLRSNFNEGKQVGGLIGYVNAFSAIGVAILLIACINFMNLATARSEKRSKEVGIRKCVGSGRKELIKQFLGESIVITSLAFFLALLFVQLALPIFNNLVAKRLLIDYSNPLVWLLSLGFILFIGIVAGSYPSFYLSSFNPAKVLKGTLHIRSGNLALRKILVTVQFFASIFLMVGTVVIYLQVNYGKKREVGYDRENLIMLNSNDEMKKNLPEIQRILIESNIIKSMTVSNSPVTDIHKNHQLDWPGRHDGENVSFARVMTGYHYTETLGIRVLQGRDFSEQFASDSSAILLNEKAVKVMGVKDPIGMEVQLLPGKEKWHVVGVVNDVIMKSPFGEVQPGFFMLIPSWIETVTIRLNSHQHLAESITNIEAIFKKLNPSYPFEYKFVDKEFDAKFEQVDIVSGLAAVFSALSILITGLGLLGLVTFTTERRTKEIGIRRILGATTASLVRLFSRDYSSLVVIGFLFATPLSWWVLNAYLNQYVYRIEFHWWIIPVTGLSLFILTISIIGTQVAKAAQNNPVDCLRTE